MRHVRQVTHLCWWPCFHLDSRAIATKLKRDRMETARGARCNHVLDHPSRILSHTPANTGLGLSGGGPRRLRSKAFKKVMLTSGFIMDYSGKFQITAQLRTVLCSSLDVVTAYVPSQPAAFSILHLTVTAEQHTDVPITLHQLTVTTACRSMPQVSVVGALSRQALHARQQRLLARHLQ